MRGLLVFSAVCLGLRYIFWPWLNRRLDEDLKRKLSPEPVDPIKEMDLKYW